MHQKKKRAHKKSQNGNEIALLKAAERGDMKRMISLVQDKWVNVDCSSETDQTPLIYAILREDYQAVSYLLLSGANPNRQDNNKRTPLMLAIQMQDSEMVDLLLEHGADPMVVIGECDDDDHIGYAMYHLFEASGIYSAIVQAAMAKKLNIPKDKAS